MMCTIQTHLHVWESARCFFSPSARKQTLKKKSAGKKCVTFSHLRCEERQMWFKNNQSIFCKFSLQPNRVIDMMSWLCNHRTFFICNKKSGRAGVLLRLSARSPPGSRVHYIKVQRRQINCWCIKSTAANMTCPLNSVNRDRHRGSSLHRQNNFASFWRYFSWLPLHSNYIPNHYVL